MREITVPLRDRSYPILIGSGLLGELGARARAAGIGGRVALVQDAGVAGLYGPAARASLEGAGFSVTSVVVPAGETSKSLAGLERLYDALCSAGLDRRSAVVTLGGGVVGDLGGFAAATYLRGVDFVQVPTTLLAQVDASVGGKTGIDLPGGKNLVGAFHQPRLVLIDLRTLDSLPPADFRSGLAEVVKYGVIADASFFLYLELNCEPILAHYPDRLQSLVTRSCEIKAGVVGEDERESGLRAILNYGHTVGHAVEAVAGYGEYLHGEAVAIGMAAAGRLAEREDRLAAADARRVERLLESFGLPIRLRQPLPPGDLLNAMRRDKKAQEGALRFVLAREIGRVEMSPVSEQAVRAVLDDVQPLEIRE